MPHAAGAVDFGYLARIVVALSAGLSVPTYNLNQWFSVLKLSTAWEFNDIQSLAISNMSSSASLKLGGLEEWRPVLDFSHHLPQFYDLRRIAITRLNDLVSTSAIQRFKLGHRYFVEDWVFESLKGLALQKDLPKLEDSRRDLGTDTALRLLYLRAQNISSCQTCSTKENPGHFSLSKFRNRGIDDITIRLRFGDELSRCNTTDKALANCSAKN
ncbi:hypothetical protein PQX77_012389 [Marasmius sp. AFHP31]|nr:hypothetical protein PQX77_012389 [Marasmius sp. AFHP31]